MTSLNNKILSRYSKQMFVWTMTSLFEHLLLGHFLKLRMRKRSLRAKSEEYCRRDSNELVLYLQTIVLPFSKLVTWNSMRTSQKMIFLADSLLLALFGADLARESNCFDCCSVEFWGFHVPSQVMKRRKISSGFQPNNIKLSSEVVKRLR